MLKAADELRRRIREEDPRKPSQCVESPASARPLKGDLDWITMRCLEKDPRRRLQQQLQGGHIVLV